MQNFYKMYGLLDYDEQVWRYLLKNFASKDDYYIILKPHPDENIEIYKKILESYPNSNAQIIDGDLFELIHLSSLVLSIISTVIIDALSLKKHVIKIDFGFSNPIYDDTNSIVKSRLEDLDQKISL